MERHVWISHFWSHPILCKYLYHCIIYEGIWHWQKLEFICQILHIMVWILNTWWSTLLEDVNVSLQAQMLSSVLIFTRDVASKEEGWKLQQRLLDRGKDILNIISLKLAVVWRGTVGHSVSTIHIAWKIPLHSAYFHGRSICFFSRHSFFRKSYLTPQRHLSPCLCVHLYSCYLNLRILVLRFEYDLGFFCGKCILIIIRWL